MDVILVIQSQGEGKVYNQELYQLALKQLNLMQLFYAAILNFVAEVLEFIIQRTVRGGDWR